MKDSVSKIDFSEVEVVHLVIFIFFSVLPNLVFSQGQQLFGTHCARCHAPIEIKRRLEEDWMGRSADQLFFSTRTKMPVESPGSLSKNQYHPN